MANPLPSPVVEQIQPVRYLPNEDPLRPPRMGIGLCLSGGGYRAMLFHLGALWRLNELGILRRVMRVSSVSGGSITAGVLGLHWHALMFDSQNTATNFQELVVSPIRAMAGVTIDVGAIIKGKLLPGTTVADQIAKAYRKHLFREATLQQLPADNEGPRFVINATNVQTKVLWRFSKPFMGDYRVGLVRNSSLELAQAVAASSGFPPFLSPVVLRLKTTDFDPSTNGGLQREPYTTRVVLTDGGVYDNLGLETVWKEYDTILVSDGSGATADEPRPCREWLAHTYRVLNIINNQVGSLRKRTVIASYQLGLRKGTYWGMRTDIADYQLPNALPCPLDQTIALANTPTRLGKLVKVQQERIINWGYAGCDAAIRRHVNTAAPAPSGFPYPAVGVG